MARRCGAGRSPRFHFQFDYGKNPLFNRTGENDVMKREMKKKLKEDEFVHGFSWLFDFVKTWKKEIAIAAAAILA
jgi:hypothetical protein